MNFDFASPVPENTTLRGTGVVPLDTAGCHSDRPCQGVVLWMEYKLVDDITTSTGLIKVLMPHLQCFSCMWGSCYIEEICGLILS